MKYVHQSITAPAGTGDSTTIDVDKFASVFVYVTALNGHNITVNLDPNGAGDFVPYGSAISAVGVTEIAAPALKLKLSSTGGTGTASCVVVGYLASTV